MRTLSLLIANYLELGEYEKRLSQNTIKAYRIDLRQFIDFTEGLWADKDMLNQYIKYLNQNFAPGLSNVNWQVFGLFITKWKLAGNCK